jgi:hypothetical protein
VVNEHSHEGTGCKWCGLDYEFVLPGEVAEACKTGRLVIFAGAGVSTEVPAVFPSTFYDEVKLACGSSADSFPQVMSDFQSKFSRRELVIRLKHRLETADSLPTLRRAARQFQAELATIPFIRDIVTTNWDTYFEEECLATPFVVGEDMAFADEYRRRVFKIHGSIANVATLIVTEDDYAQSLERLSENAIGARLRDLLMSHTVVFVGYSMRDWNFVRLYTALRSDLGKFAPRAYIVSPDSGVAVAQFDLIHLQTSGIKFVRELKNALTDECLISEDRFDRIDRIAQKAMRADEIAKAVSHRTYPAVVHCWMYLEGLTDACFRIQLRRGSGEYFDAHRVQWLVRQYILGAERARTHQRYHDAAYMEGYANALIKLFIDEEEDLDGFPFFFIYGSDDEITNPDDFQTALEQSRRRAPKQRTQARRLLGNLPDDMVLEHDRTLQDL